MASVTSKSDTTAERPDLVVNYAALNLPVYAPVVGIPGDDFLFLFCGAFVLFPVYFIAAVFWSFKGLFVTWGLALALLAALVAGLRYEMRQRPRSGIALELLRRHLSKKSLPARS